jgi:hypothetical protein
MPSSPSTRRWVVVALVAAAFVAGRTSVNATVPSLRHLRRRKPLGERLEPYVERPTETNATSAAEGRTSPIKEVG